jgi:hypothetical protein
MVLLKNITIITFLAILVGCAQAPVCRHDAVATAIINAEEGKEVRIVSYLRHAEAQVKVNGNWRYIDKNNVISVYPEKPHKPEDQIQLEISDYLLYMDIVPSWLDKNNIQVKSNCVRHDLPGCSKKYVVRENTQKGLRRGWFSTLSYR